MILGLAYLCQEAYDDAAPGYLEVGNLRFGVFDRGDHACVVFRGSANLGNWLENLEAIPVRSRSGHLAHHGFVAAAEELWAPVTRAIAGIGKPALFTGHSLGGAIAVQFAAALFCPAVTFGCPRVWWHLSGAPKLNHTRVYCDDDPVPMVPRLLFRHDDAPREIGYSDGGLPIDPADHLMSHYLERIERSAARA